MGEAAGLTVEYSTLTVDNEESPLNMGKAVELVVEEPPLKRRRLDDRQSAMVEEMEKQLEESNCVICDEEIRRTQAVSCLGCHKHVCRDCIRRWEHAQPDHRCPHCNKHGTLEANMVTMMRLYRVRHKCVRHGCDTIHTTEDTAAACGYPCKVQGCGIVHQGPAEAEACGHQCHREECPIGGYHWNEDDARGCSIDCGLIGCPDRHKTAESAKAHHVRCPAIYCEGGERRQCDGFGPATAIFAHMQICPHMPKLHCPHSRIATSKTGNYRVKRCEFTCIDRASYDAHVAACKHRPAVRCMCGGNMMLQGHTCPYTVEFDRDDEGEAL